MQLKQKLVWTLTLMAMLPLLIVLFQVVSKLEDDIQERTSEESFNTLIKMSREIKTEMGNQQSIANGLAKVPIVKAFSQVVEVDEDNQYDRRASELAIFFLNYQSTVPSIQALRFTGLSGKTLVKIKEGKLLSGKFKTSTGKQYVENIKTKAFFSWALKSKHRISISDFERGQVTGEVDFCPSMIRYSVPIRDELDILQGLLIVNMWGKRVDDAVEAALGGFSASAYIVEMSQEKHRDGIYLYHKKTEMRFANQVGSDYRFSNGLV